jgi:MFS family permease
VIVIDASIVNVTLPSIGAHLHFARADLSWVVNAYCSPSAGFSCWGRIADLLGRRRMFMLGLVVFSLASFAGGIAHSEGWLIAARAVHGLGAAIVSPAALSIITVRFAEGAERNRARKQVGGALGLAILATVANSRTQSLFHAGVHSSAVALTKGFDLLCPAGSQVDRHPRGAHRQSLAGHALLAVAEGRAAG